MGKYAAEYVDADAVADSVDHLLWMCTGDKYGQEAIDAFTEDPDSMQFDCYFLGDVAEFTVDGNTISGVDAGGNEVFSHAYKAMDMKNEDFLFYESEDADSGMFTYFAFSPDTPESTYHLESAMQTIPTTCRVGLKATTHTGMQLQSPKITTKQ